MFNASLRPGWMAIELKPEQVRIAHVIRTGPRRARLAMRHSVERAGTDTDDLARLRRSLGLQHYRCTTSVDASAYQIVALNAPSVAADEMNTALRGGVKDALDFPADDALIDSLAVPTDGAPAGRAPMVLAVAARRDRVGTRVQAFQRSG